jgi:hypothetical protein
LNTALPGTTSQAEGYVNGFIYVVPFTQLQSPDTSDVSVNVFVRSENMQFNFLTSRNIPTKREIYSESNYTSGIKGSSIPSEPVSCIPLNPSSASVDKICEDHFGERPVSFRSLLKRFYTTAQIAPGSLTIVNGHVLVSLPIFPKNNMAYGSSSFTMIDMFSYLRYAYLGTKGSIRKHVKSVTSQSNSPNWRVTAGLNTITNSEMTQAAVAVTAAAKAVTAMVRYPWEGAVAFVLATNAGIEFELPYYSSNLFSYAFSDTLDDGGSTNNMEKYWVRSCFVTFDGVSNVTPAITVESCSGEDFQFLRFQGTPYYTASIVF